VALLNTFLLMGGPYEFNFDFVDASCQCYTERIDRSCDRRGEIRFTLVPRAAVQTLAADDIIQYHLARTAPPAFDFVPLAEEDPASRPHVARILTGAEGESRLAARRSAPAAGRNGASERQRP
jgi:hypothetical protein